MLLMEKQALISVIIPVYNVEKCLSYTLKSVMRQSYENIEIIIIDDGSTDRTLKICNQFSFDSRIRIIHKENGGVSSARNLGIDIAKGKYLSFLDGDDIVAPFYIEQLLNGCKNHILSICMHERINNYNHKFNYSRVLFRDFAAEECCKKILTGNFPIGIWACLFPRETIGSLRFSENVNINEDKLFLFQYLINNRLGSVAFSNEKMYGYYIREGSASNIISNRLGDIIKVSDKISDLTLHYYPEWESLAQSNRIIGRLNALKAIIAEGNIDSDKSDVLNQIREEILSFNLPKKAGRTISVEYSVLRIGTPVYIVFVKLYYYLMNEKRRDKRNEKRVKQR